MSMKTARSLIIPVCCLCLLSLLFISGCQMKKQTEINNEEAGSSGDASGIFKGGGSNVFKYV